MRLARCVRAASVRPLRLTRIERIGENNIAARDADAANVSPADGLDDIELQGKRVFREEGTCGGVG